MENQHTPRKSIQQEKHLLCLIYIHLGAYLLCCVKIKFSKKKKWCKKLCKLNSNFITPDTVCRLYFTLLPAEVTLRKYVQKITDIFYTI